MLELFKFNKQGENHIKNPEGNLILTNIICKSTVLCFQHFSYLLTHLNSVHNQHVI